MSLIGVGIGLLTFGIAGGLHSRAVARRNERRAKSQEIERNLTLLQDEWNDTKELLDFTKKEMQSSYDLGTRRYGDNIATTQMQKSASASYNAYGIAEQNKQNYDALEDLIKQSSEQVGSVTQSIASSGFRKTGTASQLIEGTEAEAQEQKDRALAQIRYQTFANMAQAVNTNIGYNAQINQYEQALSDLHGNYKLAFEKLQIQERQAYDKYIQQKDYLESSKSNLDNYSGWAIAGEVFSDVVSYATQLGSSFIK